MLQSKFKFYQEITIIPFQEINSNFLMGKIFNSLHLLFVNNQKDGIINCGISFPGYNLKNKTVGNKIRIFFASIEIFNKLNIKKYLNKYDDYVHISNMRELPQNVEYAIFKRVQLKGNKYKLARRYSKRNNISYEKALSIYDGYIQKENTLPYIKLDSLSNGNKYNIYIEKIISNNFENNFNTFGLSLNSSVPIF